MKLTELCYKKVHFITNYGEDFIGQVEDYCFPEDNDSGIESVIVRRPNGTYVDIEPQDIIKVEIIKEEFDK